MEALLDSICKFAADDSKWEEEHLKTAAVVKEGQGEGFNLDPRTMAMAALGAGGLAGGGALSGRLSGKQLALLALLGAAAGGGGNELYQYLSQNGQPPAGGGGDEGGLLDAITPDINPSLSGALGTGLVGAGAGAGYGATRNIFTELGGQSQSSIRSVLTAPDDAEAARRLRNFLARDARLRARLGEGDAQIPSNDEVREAARNLRTFAQQRGINPNDPQSIRDVEQALRGGSLDIDYEGAVPDDVRQRLEAEQGLRTRAGELERELARRAGAGQLKQRANAQQRAMRYEIPDELMEDPSQLKTYDRLRQQIDEFERLRGQLPEGETPDPTQARARGRLNLLTGEIPKLDVDGRTFEGVRLPGAFDTISAVRNRLNAGPGFQARRFMPSLRGIGGAAAGGAGLGALVGGLFGND